MTDAAAQARLRQVYYSRGRVLQTLAARPDTAGNYAAIRTANDLASSQVKTIVTDQTAYHRYTDNQGSYYAGPYTAAVVTTAGHTGRTSPVWVPAWARGRASRSWKTTTPTAR